MAIDFNKTALVLIDLQEGIVGMDYHPYSADTVIENANKLIDTFRKNNGLIAFVHVDHKGTEHDIKPDTQMKLPELDIEDFAAFANKLHIQDNDYVVTKSRFSAFTDTGLDTTLRRRGIDTIVLGGVATHAGVDTTARAAHELNYNQYFITDMMSSITEDMHNFPINNMFPFMGYTLTTEEFLKNINA